jgi:riboflavin-specific deaminase-like protein
MDPRAFLTEAVAGVTFSGRRREMGLIEKRVAAVLEEMGRKAVPVVTLAWAQTLNGAIARSGGAPVKISSREALVMTHSLRSLHAGILVGVGTVLSDDPLLSVRLIRGPQPRPIILDSQLRTPPDARIFESGGPKPWIFHGPHRAGGDPLLGRGARLLEVGEGVIGLDLTEILAILAREGIWSLMVEGGAAVLSSFLASRLAHQIVVTVAPRLMAGATSVDVIKGAEDLFLEGPVWERCGRDITVWGRVGTESANECN